MNNHTINTFKAALLTSVALTANFSLAQAADQTAAPTHRTLDEIVVTAQKRTENVQDVPIAISTFSADNLSSRGISNVVQLGNVVPNVTLDAGTPFSGSSNVLAAFIRGIGQNDFAFNLDPGVGVYVDGVYLARSVGANSDLLDIERVEILKGPQGDLFGRNTIGGAISIITRRPSEELSFTGEVSTGSFERLDIKGSADIPLSETLLTTVTFAAHNRDGYQKRIPFPGAVTQDVGGFKTSGVGTTERDGGTNDWIIRGKALWIASDDVEVTLAGDYFKTDESGQANSLLKTETAIETGGVFGFFYNTCINAPTAILGMVGLSAVCGPRGVVGTGLASVNADADPNNDRLSYSDQFITDNIDETYATGNSFSRIKNYGSSVTVDWDLADDMSLKSITAYREIKWTSAQDNDASPVNILETSFQMDQKQFSQELQLTGTTLEDKLDYVLGLYYFDESGNLHDYVTFPGGLLQVDGNNEIWTKSYAAYAHLNYRFTEEFSVTLGARYTAERKKFEGFQQESNAVFYKLANLPVNAASAAILGFTDPDNLLRLYPDGVNELNFNNFSPKIGLEYKPSEDLLLYASFSRGFKSGGWTTRLTEPLVVPAGQTKAKAPDFGPEKASTYEVGMKSEFMDRRVQVNAAGFYTDYEGIQLNFQTGTSPTLANAGDAEIYGFEVEFKALATDELMIGANVGYLHAKYTTLDFAVTGVTLGHDLPKTPEWKFSLNPQYRIDLANNGQLLLNVDYTHTTSLSNDTENVELLRRPAVDMLNASVTYVSPEEKWQFSIGGTNLLDERYLVTGQANIAGGVVYGTYSRPAEWYATLRIKM